MDTEEIGDSGADLTAARERLSNNSTELGREAVGDPVGLAELLPELVTGIAGRRAQFGYGIALGTTDPEGVWRQLHAALTKTSPRERRLDALFGFLTGLAERNRELVNRLLDDAFNDDTLGIHFPYLQTAVEIGPADIDRLHRSLIAGRAPIDAYRVLSGGRATDPIDGQALEKLLLVIAEKQGGVPVAVDILQMRLFSDRQSGRPNDPHLLEAGVMLLATWEPTGESHDAEYAIGELVRTCFVGTQFEDNARRLCQKIAVALSNWQLSTYDVLAVLKAIYATQPKAALDVFSSSHRLFLQITKGADDAIENPLSDVPSETILTWCEIDPQSRYVLISHSIPLFLRDGKDASRTWTPIALTVLERAPDKVAVLDAFVSNFRPSSWSGSLATILEERTNLLQVFEGHSDAIVARAARSHREKLIQTIGVERERERREDLDRDEKFE